MTERAAHLKLAVDIGSEPITGSLAVDSQSPQSFCGWIELVAAIEAARHNGGVERVGARDDAAAETALG